MAWFTRKKPLTALARPMLLHDLRKRTKIVVIDDEPDSFPIKALLDEGFTIEHWPEVKSIDRLERGDFDIIILDITGVAKQFSPDEDGLGVLQHLKDKNPMQILVAFSGQSFDLSKQKFFRLADDTMPKPVNPLKCKQVLDHLIESRMTVQHMWETLATLLHSEGVSDKQIKKLELQVSSAIANGSATDYELIVGQFVHRAELITKIATIIGKIAAFCGL